MNDSFERDLWRRVVRPPLPERDAVDTMTLAAYLDGRISDETRRRVETELAASPALRRELVELRELVAVTAETPPVPLAVVRAARDLVGARTDDVAPAAPPAPPAPARSWRLAMRWSMAAAAAVAACLLGYQAGVTSVGSTGVGPDTEANVDTVMAFGLLADEDESDADLLAMLLGEVTS